jgi:hypothetical protein
LDEIGSAGSIFKSRLLLLRIEEQRHDGDRDQHQDHRSDHNFDNGEAAFSVIFGSCAHS